jgi:hypothetical protein
MNTSKAAILSSLEAGKVAIAGDKKFSLKDGVIILEGAEAPLTLDAGALTIWKLRKDLKFI